MFSALNRRDQLNLLVVLYTARDFYQKKLESSKSLRPNAKLCTFLEVYGVGKCMCSYSIDINTQPRTKFTRPTLLPRFGLFFE